jgi:hypothetical protein
MIQNHCYTRKLNKLKYYFKAYLLKILKSNFAKYFFFKN